MEKRPTEEQLAKYRKNAQDQSLSAEVRAKFKAVVDKFDNVAEKIGEDVVKVAEPKKTRGRKPASTAKAPTKGKKSVDDIEKAKAEIKAKTGKTEAECESIIEQYRALRTKAQEGKRKAEQASADNKERVEKLDKKGDIIEGTNEKTADAVIESTAKDVVEKIEKEVEAVEAKAETEAKAEVAKDKTIKTPKAKKEAVEAKVEEKVKEKTKTIVKRVVIDTSALLTSIATSLGKFDKDSQKEFLIKLRSDIDKLLSKYSAGGITDGAVQVMNVQQSNLSASSVNPTLFGEGGGVGKKLSYEEFVETLRENDKIDGYTGKTTYQMEMYYLPSGHRYLGKTFAHKNKRKAYQEYLSFTKAYGFEGGGGVEYVSWEITFFDRYDMQSFVLDVQGDFDNEQDAIDEAVREYDIYVDDDNYGQMYYNGNPVDATDAKRVTEYRKFIKGGGVGEKFIHENRLIKNGFELTSNKEGIRVYEKPNYKVIIDSKKQTYTATLFKSTNPETKIYDKKLPLGRFIDLEFGTKFANGGIVGQEIVFDDNGEENTGVIKEIHETTGDYIVNTDDGRTILAQLDRDVISLGGMRKKATMDAPRKRFGFFEGGGGVSDVDYSDILAVLEDKLTEAVANDIPNDFENSYNATGEEVESKSRDGFIPYTDGGYEVRWFEYLSQFYSGGYSLPTKALDKEKDRQIEYNFQLAKERFTEDYPEIVEELGEENIDYNSLYEAGYESEAEELSEMEMNFDGEETIMCEVGAYYYSPSNDRGMDGEHTLRLFGLVNLESPYHRSGNLEDRYDIDITFNSIEELEEQVEAGLKEITDWFNGSHYDESTKELRINRMAKGGMTEHGLRLGDKIVAKGVYTIQVKDSKNKKHIVNLNRGTREDSFGKGGNVSSMLRNRRGM